MLEVGRTCNFLFSIDGPTALHLSVSRWRSCFLKFDDLENKMLVVLFATMNIGQ